MIPKGTERVAGAERVPSERARRGGVATTQQRLFCSVRVYVGQTRSRAFIEQLNTAGIGECVTPGRLPPRRGFSWFYDTGAYSDWKRGRSFNYLQFSRDLRAIRMWQERGVGRGIFKGQPMTAPDFIVLPDVVGQGEASLEFSIDHLEETQRTGARCYLAVQDGVTPARILNVLGLFPSVKGLFVGGTTRWKLETAAAWCALGRRTGRAVHIGRVGTLERIEWAQSIGATSIDSSLPLWERDRLNAFIRAVA